MLTIGKFFLVGLVQRQATSWRKRITVADRRRRKKEFANRVNEKIIMYDIDECMVINFDETNLPVLPVQLYTMEVRCAGAV